MNGRPLRALVAVWLLTTVAWFGCSRNSDQIDGPAPSLTGTQPDLVCIAQGSKDVTLQGEGLAPLLVGAAKGDPQVVLPQIGLTQTADLQGAQIQGTEVVLDPTALIWLSQQSLVMSLAPELNLDPGVYSVRATNGSGQQASLNEALVVVGPPALSAIAPELVCLEQGSVELTLTGQGFLEIDGNLPTITLGGLSLVASRLEDCTDLPATSLDARRCDTLVVTLAQDSLAPGAYPVVVTNPAPADCHTSEPVELVVVPAPVLAAISPDLVCIEQAGLELTLSGSGFLEIDGSLPAVAIGGLILTADRLDGCSPVGTATLVVQTCDTLVVSLAQDALAPGAYPVVVTNPAPADCMSLEAVQLAVVPGPQVASVEPELACAEQQQTEFELAGSGFLDVDGTLPTVELDGAVYPALTALGCSPVAGTLLAVQTCTGLTFQVPAGAHAPGWQDLLVTNPPPADCVHAADAALYLAPTPIIDRVAPAVACDRDPTELVITGAGFLELDGQGPQVSVAGTAAGLLALEGCTAISGLSSLPASLCTGLRVQVPAGTVTPDAYQVVVQNPDPMACSASHDSSIGFPPQVSGVTPSQLCSSGGTITVTGDGFRDGALVSISNQSHQAELATTFIDAQTLAAQVPGPTPPGLYDLTVTNPDGCATTLVGVFDITPQPVVYFVDPFSIYNAINLQVVIYTSGILGQVAEVLLYPTGQPQAATSLAFTYDQAQRVQAVIPAGLAPGSYSVRVTDDLGCSGSLDDAVAVVEQLSLAIERVELPFGWTSGKTGVNVYSPQSPDPGFSNFAPTPRFYLNPQAAGPGSLASELTRTAFVLPTRVSAVVPAGLPVGTYDLVAVNPDGAVGLLVDAFQVTTDPPPLIEELAPSSVVNQDTQIITIRGTDFRDPVFSASCLQPDASLVAMVGSVDSFDATTIAVSINFVTQTIADGSICIIRVTNSDATYSDFSALGVTNPSLNLEHFDATGDLNVARRAPCAASGVPLPGARFVYAIGGDDGTTQDSVATNRYDSIEMAAVDPFGDLTPWSLMPIRLPAVRAFAACASVGRFVYVVGGNGGAGAEATAWRAQVLDPDQAPEIVDVDLLLDQYESMLFAPGRYSYRVSALMDPADPVNPGGETLAGDPFLIQIPNIPQRVSISITFSEVIGAAGYRVYRTEAPGQGSGTERLLAELPADQRSYLDDGGQSVGAETALPLGALSQFATLAALTTPREGAALAVARDPVDPSLRHLYLLGGRDASAVGLNSIERLTVQPLADGSQPVVAGWLAGAADIGPARWQLGAFVADQYSGPDIVPTDETWIYAAGGLRADLSVLVPEVVALKVEAGGALGESAGARWALGTMQPFRAGYAAMLFNNQLFAFGGTNAMPVTEGSSVEMCLNSGGICSGGAPEPPDLMNWNNLGLNMTVARYLTSSVTVSAFIFLIGGLDIAYQPLAATEKTLW